MQSNQTFSLLRLGPRCQKTRIKLILVGRESFEAHYAEQLGSTRKSRFIKEEREELEYIPEVLGSGETENKDELE